MKEEVTKNKEGSYQASWQSKFPNNLLITASVRTESTNRQCLLNYGETTGNDLFNFS